MNRSYRSSSQISKRLSRLRAQSRESESSRVSRLSRDHSFTSKKNHQYQRPIFKTPCKPIVCETLNVKHLDERRVMDMKIMFGVGVHT